MRALHRKLFRELWQTRWQAIAIVLIMASGVSMVVMSVSTLQSLELTRSAFYEQARFAHGFLHLKRAPLSIIPRIRQLPGVSAVEPRVVKSVILDVSGLSEPATGRVVSLPDHGEPRLNRLHLQAGRWLDPNRREETLVSQAFAHAHQLKPGDTIRAIINGKRQSLLIVGVALSPEYVYSVRPGELLPDDKRFGVLWMRYEELAAAFDLDGAFNDLSLTWETQASEREIFHRLNALMAPYGGTDAEGRERQSSHRFLENELIQLRTMALVPPAIFLAVTAFLLHVVMSRMVAMQREQIATLRAFGYTRSEVAWHFLEYAFVISLIGSWLGVLLGARLGMDLTELYTKFFRFPEFHYSLDWRLALGSMLIGLAAASAGVGQAVWRAAQELPAQAMQPEAPPRYRTSWLEHWGLVSNSSQLMRMILRHLERKPLRACFSSLGISFSIAMLIMGNFLQDTVDHVMHFQFFEIQRQDLMVGFAETKSCRALRELQHMPGVLGAEPFRSVPIRLTHRQHERRLDLLGLTANSRLLRVVDPNTGPIELPEHGLVLSRRLAEILECQPGDYLQLQVLEGRRISQAVVVKKIVDDYLDLNAYMRLEDVRHMLQEQDTISGAFLSTDALQLTRLYKQLKQTPQVAGVGIKRTALESYQQTMAENILRMKTLNVIFASIVAFGVVYNCARISLAERSRELATLRVLGFTRAEVSQVLLGELAILVILAIPIGLGFGYFLAWILTATLHTEVHRFPLIIHTSTYVQAVLVASLAAIFSALVVRRRMDHFDLVQVLKTRD